MTGETLFKPALQVGSGEQTALNLTADTLIKAGPGRLVRVSVTTAGAAGAVHDAAAIGGAAAGNLIGVVPATVGIYFFDWPCVNGIVYKLGAGQVVSISYA